MATILVTGTSRGIGKSAAEEFLKNGWKVIGTSTSNVTPINHKNYKHIKLDLSSVQEIEFLIQSIRGESLDCILNNAAILLEEWSSPNINFQQLSHTLQVNLIGPIRLTEGLLHSLKPGGKIINVSSNWGSFSDFSFDQYHPNYKISKAALNMYTKLLAARRADITVIAFDPGWVRTDMGGNGATRDPLEVAKDLLWLTTQVHLFAWTISSSF